MAQMQNYSNHETTEIKNSPGERTQHSIPPANRMSILMAEELEPLRRNPTLWQDTKLFIGIIPASCFIGISHSGSSLMNFLGYLIVDRTGNEVEISAFGLSVFFYMATSYLASQAIIEKAAISCSLAFGEKNYDLMKTIFIRGLLFFGAFSLFLFFPICLASEHVFLAIGTDAAIAAKTRQILVKLFAFDIIRLLSEYMIAYMTSQGFETGYGLLTFVTLSLSMPVAFYLGVNKRMGVDGLIIGRVILEVSKILYLIATYCIKIPNNSLKLKHLSAAFQDLGSFLLGVLVFAVGCYSEEMCVEIAVFFVALTNDANQIAAFTILVNFLYLYFNIAYGFGVLIRTRVNFLVGRKRIAESKYFFKLSMIGLGIFGFLFSILLYSTRKLITGVYAEKNAKVREYLEQLLVTFCFTL
jgi:Na+-driven multidrug efflux pump